MQRPLLQILFLAASLWLWPVVVLGGETNGLEDLSLEELMDVEVVTATRRPESINHIPGAVTVLDEEDLYHSGALTVADALRMVPGVHVGRMDTDKWAVGIRGFNGLLSNKHLVLLDGRPITSPTTAGVDWGNTVPVSMVKRIEVVRGTWTSLWGADSFTGVINIITKTAEEMQGGQTVTVVGIESVEQLVRYGSTVGDNGHAAGYLKGGYTSGDEVAGVGDKHSSKDWTVANGGFRYDWENAYTDLMTVQGAVHSSRIRDGAGGTPYVHLPKTRVDYSGYGQFVWDRATGLDAGVRFRTSFSRGGIQVGGFTDSANTVDAELQYAAEQTGIHRLTWGGGARYSWSDMSEDKDNVDIGREHVGTFTASTFIQDRLTLVPESVFLFLGTKVDFLGDTTPELQPSVRLLHTREDSEYWLAASRAVRSDSRYQRSGTYSIRKDGITYTLTAPGDLSTEQLFAYEVGYRHHINPRSCFDLSLYINDYDDLIMVDFNDATNTATLENSLKGTAYGVESLFEWRAAEWLTLQPSASVIYQRLYGVEELPVGESMPEDGWAAEVKLQLLTRPADNVDFDLLVGYVDSPGRSSRNGSLMLAVHAGWRASDRLLLEGIAQNLAGPISEFSILEVDPSVNLRVTWDF